MLVRVLLISELLFGGMIAPAYAAVEDDPSATPKPAVAGDGMKHFFEGVLTRIDELIEKEKDVIELEEANTALKELVQEVENVYSAAQSLVDLHSGFHDKGRATDLAEAQGTINTIKPNLITAREKIIEAVRVV